MSTSPAGTAAPASDVFAANVRAHLARRGQSLRSFAFSLGKPEHWSTRRLTVGRSVDVTLEDAELIAAALDVPLDVLLTP